MKYLGTLIAVTDMERSKQFYKEVFGLEIEADFGANVSLTGGIFLQTLPTWREFINAQNGDVTLKNRAGELYFETDDIEDFISRLDKMKVEYVHRLREQPWGQRVVRLYDPDGHIIEVGENMVMVVKRFLSEGMTAAQVAKRMDVPEDYVQFCIGLHNS